MGPKRLLERFELSDITGRMPWIKRAERRDRRALDLMRHPHHRRLHHRLVAHQGALDLHRSQAVAGDVDHIINPPHDPEITTLIPTRAVAGEIHPLHATEIRLDEPLAVAENSPQHRGPGLADDEQAARIDGHLLAILVDHRRVNAEERQGAAARHGRRRPGQGRDHVTAGFRLPPGIDDGAFFITDDLVIPHPRLGIDRLPDRPQYFE